MDGMDTLLSPLSATSTGLQPAAAQGSASLPPATPSAPPPLGAGASSSSFASRVGNGVPSTRSSMEDGVSAAVMMGGGAEGVTGAVVSATDVARELIRRATQLEGRAPGRGASDGSAAVRAGPLGQAHSHHSPMGADPVRQVINNPVAASSGGEHLGRTMRDTVERTVSARRQHSPPTGLPTRGAESGASAHAARALVTGGASNSSVTAESVLQEAIALPAGERVLFFNDLRLHLHREGLLSVRNRASKRQRVSEPDALGAPHSAPVPLDAHDGDPVGTAPVGSAPLPPLTFSTTVTTMTTTIEQETVSGLPPDGR
jgi:hypothetical protein